MFEDMKFEISKIKGVEHVEIIVNSTPYFDHGTQLEAYSFRVIVAGGKDKKIAKVIWMNKPIGAIAVGNTKVTFKSRYDTKHTIEIEKVF